MTYFLNSSNSIVPFPSKSNFWYISSMASSLGSSIPNPLATWYEHCLNSSLSIQLLLSKSTALKASVAIGIKTLSSLTITIFQN